MGSAERHLESRRKCTLMYIGFWWASASESSALWSSWPHRAHLIKQSAINLQVWGKFSQRGSFLAHFSKNPNYNIITHTATVQSERPLECHLEMYRSQMLPMLAKTSEAWAKLRHTIFPSFLRLFFTLFLLTATINNVPCLPHLLTKTCIPAC